MQKINPFEISFESEKRLNKFFFIFKKIFNTDYRGINIYEVLSYSLGWRIFPLIRDELLSEKCNDKSYLNIFNKIKEREKFLKYKLFLRIFKFTALFFIFLILRKKRKAKVLTTFYLKDIDFLYYTQSFKFFLKKRDSFYFPKYSFFLKSSFNLYLDSRKFLKKLFFKLPSALREKYREIFTYYLFYRIPFLFSYLCYLERELKNYEYFITHENVTKFMIILKKFFNKSFTLQHGHVWKKGVVAMGEFGFFIKNKDNFFVWGEEFKKRFLERNIDEKFIFVTGSPFHVSLFKREKKYQREKGRILYITQQAKGMEDELIYIFSTFLEGYKRALEVKRDLFLVIKARKRENLKIYKELLKKIKFKNFFILTTNLWDEIEKAEIVFSSYSTAIYEALFLNNYIFCIFPKNLTPPFPYDLFKIPFSTDPEEIRNYIINPYPVNNDKNILKKFFDNLLEPDSVFVKIKDTIK
ncbi:MAG: hypothetical protein ABIM58_03745 [candidate division WOR-3 bacterium]